MRLSNRSSEDKAGRVLLVAPVPPPYGGMALQAGLLRRLLEEDGAVVELLGHNRAFRRFKFVERIPAVRTVLRMVLFCTRFWKQARRADVVHILSASWLNFFLVVCPAILLARLRRKRVVLNYRAGDAEGFLRCYGRLARPFFQMAHAVTAPSGFLAEVIERRTDVPVSIVPNIANTSIFKYRERTSFEPKILVTRHLEKLYDVESVMRAFGEVQAAYQEASLWIAGTGSQEARLRELVSEWRLRNVRFLGHVDHARLPSIYDQCDVLLNASRIDNFPGSLMEASAAGLVVVSTKAGGIPFVYEDGKNALLVEIGDWQELGRAVKRVLDDQELGRKLISEGSALCRHYEWRNIRTALYSAYGFDTPSERSDHEPAADEFALKVSR
jgi:glycosyltransferase involved in cell wall biosynthesis